MRILMIQPKQKKKIVFDDMIAGIMKNKEFYFKTCLLDAEK